MINKIHDKIKEHNSNLKKQLYYSTIEELSCSIDPKLANVFDKTKKQVISISANTKTDKINDTAPENKYRSVNQKINIIQCQKIPLKQSQENNSLSMKNVNAPNKATKRRLFEGEVKIQSALAASIIESRNNTQMGKRRKMVSVLKNPPIVSQSSLLKSNCNENVASIPSNVNKYLERVQNLIVQNTSESLQEEEKKQPRRKLNLAEYRNRRDLTSNNDTNFPTQWKYVYHSYTMTNPLKDKLNNPIWSETEFLLQEIKSETKLSSHSIGIQTYETVFEFSKSSITEQSEER